jgi:hypothetical protein
VWCGETHTKSYVKRENGNIACCAIADADENEMFKAQNPKAQN